MLLELDVAVEDKAGAVLGFTVVVGPLGMGAVVVCAVAVRAVAVSAAAVRALYATSLPADVARCMDDSTLPMSPPPWETLAELCAAAGADAASGVSAGPKGASGAVRRGADEGVVVDIFFMRSTTFSYVLALVVVGRVLCLTIPEYIY